MRIPPREKKFSAGSGFQIFSIGGYTASLVFLQPSEKERAEGFRIPFGRLAGRRVMRRGFFGVSGIFLDFSCLKYDI